jgi:hypothetical protein
MPLQRNSIIGERVACGFRKAPELEAKDHFYSSLRILRQNLEVSSAVLL